MDLPASKNETKNRQKTHNWPKWQSKGRVILNNVKTKEMCERTDEAKYQAGESNIKEEKRMEQHQKRQREVKGIKGSL